MRKPILFFLTALLVAASAEAKEILTMLNGDEIEVEIISIGSSEIQYKKASNPDGPTFTTSRDNVFFIIFPDGTKEIITDITKPQAPTQTNNSNGTFGGLITGAVRQGQLTQPTDVIPPTNYFPRISFYPRVAVGYHATGSEYIDWGGLYWAVDANLLFPSSNNTAWSLGIGVMGLGGEAEMLVSDTKKYSLGDLSSMYLTIPFGWYYRSSDWFMFGCSNRLEILISESLNGNTLEDTFSVFRDSFTLDAMATINKFDFGAQIIFNLCNAFKGEDIGWSPTIGLAFTAGYRF